MISVPPTVRLRKGVSKVVELPRHLYVHVPFCARRCTYCDFAIAVRRTVPTSDFVDAIARELAIQYPSRREWPVDTIYLGGGTPSLLGAEGLERLMGSLYERVSPQPGCEITIEANPDDVSVECASAWRASGINRLSIGAQSFDGGVLGWMHRTHSSGQIARAVDAARTAGVENVSVDLIFALPDSISRNWERDVRLAMALSPSHVSLYGLTVEPRTPLGRWRDSGLVTESPDERYEEEFLLAHAILTDAGFEHYEVSNYARPGRRARHNSSYWARVPYTGLGPSAHGFDGERRRWNTSAYSVWLKRLLSGLDPVEGVEVLSEENCWTEAVYLALRTSDGFDLADCSPERAGAWVEAGWAVLNDDRLRLTPTGWLRLDSIAAALTFEARSTSIRYGATTA